MENGLDIIARHAEAGARLRRAFFADNAGLVDEAARRMARCLSSGGKILLAGNGGSAADAQHWAGEFVNRFIMDRPPLPALALTTDTSVLTAIGNDFGYDQIFAKQVQALGRSGDVFLGISTSGNSPNILAALEEARKGGLFTIGLTGEGGGRMAPLCDLLLAVPVSAARDVASQDNFAAGQDDLMITPLIQEVHACIGHLLCGLVDVYLFSKA